MKKNFLSFSFLPFFALTTAQLTFLIVMLVLLVAALIYGIFLFIKYNESKKQLEVDDEPKVVLKETIKEEVKESIKEETPLKEIDESKKEVVVEDKPEVKEVIRYNYSLKAHIMLAPEESIERYLKIKNHILSYPDVKISQSWKFESFKYGARTLAKITLQGKTLRIYFDLDPAQFENTVYNIKNEGGKVNHRSTPTMFVVRGNRGVKHANELTDIYFNDLNIKRGDDLVYELPNYTETFEELIEQGLIKVPKSK